MDENRRHQDNTNAVFATQKPCRSITVPICPISLIQVDSFGHSSLAAAPNRAKNNVMLGKAIDQTDSHTCNTTVFRLAHMKHYITL